MSVAISFVGEDHAVLATDARATRVDMESDEILGTVELPKLSVMESGRSFGFVAAVGPCEAANRVARHLADRPAGDADVLKGAMEASASLVDSMAVLQVFSSRSGDLGTLFLDSDGETYRLTEYGESLIAPPPLEGTNEEFEAIQHDMMRSAHESGSVDELIRVAGDAVHAMASVSRWIGGSAQVGVAARNGEASVAEVLCDGQEPVLEPPEHAERL